MDCPPTEDEGVTALKKNLIACPFSVAHSLAFLWSCAAEKTADELAKVLGFKGRLAKEVVARMFGDLHEEFAECAEMKLAHKLFVNSGKAAVAIKDKDARDALDGFSVETETIKEQQCLKLSDFMARVNKWTESIANKEGEEAKQPSTLMNNSAIADKDSIRPWILMDVLNFDSPWAIEFPAENTTEQRFWTSESSSVDVQMMHLRESCRYGYMLEMEAAILELDLDFEDFSLLFLVPDSRTGLADVLKKLQSTNVMYLAAQLRRQDTLVYVPKFKVDVTFALDQDMLGKFVSDPDVSASALRQSADHLSGLFTAAGKVDGGRDGDAVLLHRAVIAVGEKGAEKDKQKIGEPV